MKAEALNLVQGLSHPCADIYISFKDSHIISFEMKFSLVVNGFKDETTDNFTSFIFFIGETLYITYEFWRETHHDKEQIGKVNWFVHEETEVFKVLKEAIRCMS